MTVGTIESRLRVLSIFGTRPDAIKMAPLISALKKEEKIDSICCVTGQHREMLHAVLQVFSITPDMDLGIMSHNQTVEDVTVRALTGVREALEHYKPDLCLVHGDTTTAFASALAAFYAKIPVGHVEAGLRSHDRYSPHPEEMNRRLISRIASLHFCPTEQNKQSLEAEGITKGVFVTGNTVIDAMGGTVSKNYSFEEPFLNTVDFKSKRVILITAHRRENYNCFSDIFKAFRDIADKYEDILMIYPVHPAPAVKNAAQSILSGHERIKTINPLGVLDMHNLISRSYFILTDSGGLQEEAPAMGKPVLVLRRETERPEAIEAGTVKLAGVKREDIIRLASQLLDDCTVYDAMSRAVSPYGDGFACRRIIDIIKSRDIDF